MLKLFSQPLKVIFIFLKTEGIKEDEKIVSEIVKIAFEKKFFHLFIILVSK
jgi:citrate lyase synthetase